MKCPHGGGHTRFVNRLITNLCAFLMVCVCLGCASRRAYHPPLGSIELRNATITDERDGKRSERCDIADWIYDAGQKHWVAICKQLTTKTEPQPLSVQTQD